MKIHVLTSCTGDKAVAHADQLTMGDFQSGDAHIAARETALSPYCRTAEEMYTGQQHVRLMQGVQSARMRGLDVRLTVISAGYGFIEGTRLIAPYNATFNDMPTPAYRTWATTLDIASRVHAFLAEAADLTLILLGDRYLDASCLDAVSQLGAPTIAFCGLSSRGRFGPRIATVPFQQSDTKRFGSSMIGLKGELAKRLLSSPDVRGTWSLERLAACADFGICRPRGTNV